MRAQTVQQIQESTNKTFGLMIAELHIYATHCCINERADGCNL